MGRKNSSVRRTNSRGRLDRRQRGEHRMPQRDHTIERVRVEDIVLPVGKCHFQAPRKGKAKFPDEQTALKALEQAQKMRARSGSGRVEKRIYKCPEGGCGGWHLTSRESFDEDLWRSRRELKQ